MRLVSILALLSLCGCVGSPCPPYSGFAPGRSWSFADGEGTSERREVRSLVEDEAGALVSLRAVFTTPTSAVTGDFSFRCDEAGVHFLEEEIDLDGVIVGRVFSTPELVLPADPRPGQRFGGPFAGTASSGEAFEGSSAFEVQETPAVDTPEGRLEVLAFVAVDAAGATQPERGALRHRELGLVGFLGARALELVSIDEE